MYKKITLLVLFMTMPFFMEAMSNEQALKQDLRNTKLDYIAFKSWIKESNSMLIGSGHTIYLIDEKGTWWLAEMDGIKEGCDTYRKELIKFACVLHEFKERFEEYRKPLENIKKHVKNFGVRLNFHKKKSVPTFVALENPQGQSAVVEFNEDTILNPEASIRFYKDY